MSEYQLTDYKTKLIQLKQNIGEHLEPFGASHPAAAQAWQRIQEIYAEKLDATKPEVMVYGIYNAGKSSIINELLGEDKAETDDIPTTHTISQYFWQGYQLTDTPGVGAPKDDEQVTQEHLRGADVVIFVMSTTGSNEKRDNYERMRDIAAAGKKIIIVLNDKNGDIGTDEGNFNIQAIKTKVVNNMKQVGVAKANQYFIVSVNASYAKNGRHMQQEGKRLGNEILCKKGEILLNKSNMHELANVIMQELRHTNTFVILANATREICTTLEGILAELEGDMQDGGSEKLTALLQQVRERREEIHQNMAAFIENRAKLLGHQLPVNIWSMRDSSQEQITAMVNKKVGQTATLVQKQLELEIGDLINDMLDETEAIKMTPEEISFHPDEIKKPAINNEINDSSLDMKGIVNGMRDILKSLQETINVYNTGKPVIDGAGTSIIEGKLIGDTTTQAVKSLAGTSLGKSILSTTVGKTVLGPILPVVGPVISTLPLLIKLLGGTDDRAQLEAEVERQNAQARRQAELEQQARTELDQKCQYMAADLADTFKISVDSTLQQIAIEITRPFKEHARQLNDKARKTQEDLAALHEAVDDCRRIETSLRASTSTSASH
ncbi:GTPase [uncultured Mitsuokella sp.]|uniref:GTPase n=1 Tax=uncultured Mitsuokella sp. TaxID=453120 RepID=UPI0026708507|nr:GTPase [uncultured Mitsuokella sp.]